MEEGVGDLKLVINTLTDYVSNETLPHVVSNGDYARVCEHTYQMKPVPEHWEQAPVIAVITLITNWTFCPMAADGMLATESFTRTTLAKWQSTVKLLSSHRVNFSNLELWFVCDVRHDEP